MKPKGEAKDEDRVVQGMGGEEVRGYAGVGLQLGEDVGDVGLVERLEGVLSDSGMECPGAEAF